MADRNNQNFNRLRRALRLTDNDIYQIMLAAGRQLSRTHINGWHAKADADEGQGAPNQIMSNDEFDAFCLGVELTR